MLSMLKMCGLRLSDNTHFVLAHRLMHKCSDQKDPALTCSPAIPNVCGSEKCFVVSSFSSLHSHCISKQEQAHLRLGFHVQMDFSCIGIALVFIMYCFIFPSSILSLQV